MTLPAFGLLILAALLHLGWNLQVKRSKGTVITLWLGFVWGALIYLPLLIIHLPVPVKTWIYVIPSALCQTAYIGALGNAYKREDFSLVYPIARGAAPGLLALWSIVFFKETPSLAGLVGLGIIILGLLLVGGSSLIVKGHQPLRFSAGVSMAMVVAIIISVYSAIDGAAVKFTDALSYTILSTLLAALFTAPIILRNYGWQKVQKEFTDHWPITVLVGILMVAAYALVLIVYSLSTVSYAGAVREISIVFGALAGWLWFKEKFGPMRVAGSWVIFAGILLILANG
jgi:drug/metabolite transporter (DMT)-like permease